MTSSTRFHEPGGVVMISVVAARPAMKNRA
jgi:hypothetical protein